MAAAHDMIILAFISGPGAGTADEDDDDDDDEDDEEDEEEDEDEEDKEGRLESCAIMCSNSS